MINVLFFLCMGCTFDAGHEKIESTITCVIKNLLLKFPGGIFFTLSSSKSNLLYQVSEFDSIFYPSSQQSQVSTPIFDFSYKDIYADYLYIYTDLKMILQCTIMCSDVIRCWREESSDLTFCPSLQGSHTLCVLIHITCECTYNMCLLLQV